MAEVGIKTAYVYVNGKTIELDHSYLGVAKADIKGLQGNLTNVSGSNTIQYSYSEPAKPTVALTINQAGMKLIADLTGLKQSSSGGFYTPGDSLPSVGVAVVAPELGVDKNLVYAFPNCRATYTQVSLSTNTDSKKNVVYDQINFNANNSPKINALYGIAEVTDGGEADVLTGLGWSAPQQGQGDFKDATTDGSSTSSSVHS